MPLAPCATAVDSRGRELVDHGTTAFPIACYFDDLSREEVPWHWHEELEAAVILEGRAVIAAGNEKFTLGPGEGFFVNSGVLHGCWQAEGSGCRFHSLVFHPRLVGGSLDSVFHQSYVGPLTGHKSLAGLRLMPGCDWQRRSLNAIEEAWQACVTEPPGYEFTVRERLSELVWLLHANRPASPKAPGAKALRDGERIKGMLQFIHDHFDEELSTARIAAHAAVSESECLRCFRATIGTTPIRYLRQYRIQQAARLLTETDLPVADICARCGFQDVSYFTKTFGQLKGCTPSRFRRRDET